MPSIQNFDVQAVHTVPTVQYIPLTSLYRSHYASVPHGEDGSNMVEMAV